MVKKSVATLIPGDVMFASHALILAAFRDSRTPPRHRSVYVRYKDGRTVRREWRADTRVAVR